MDSPAEKVAIYVPSLRGGGAERVMAIIAAELADLGYDVDLLLAQKQGPYLDKLSSKVSVVDFGKKRVLNTLFGLRRYLNTERPSVILSAMAHTNIVTLVAVMLSSYKPRVVVSERGSPLAALVGGGRLQLFRHLRRIFYRRADAVVPVSSGVARELEEDFGVPRHLLRTIYNPVHIHPNRAIKQEVPDHPWLKGSHQVFIAVGRLTPIKGYESLLAAFSLVSKKVPSARLIVLGEGESRSHLFAIVRDLELEAKVDFVGFQPEPHLWMAASDVYVLSSRSEGLPNAMLQAMASGLKIVSTDCEHGPSEILGDGQWGRLVPVGDVQALAREMSHALVDQDPPDVQSRVKMFDTDTIVQQYLEVLGLEPA